MNETDDEVRIVPPEIAEVAAAVSVLSEFSEDGASEDEQFEFALESHAMTNLLKRMARPKGRF